MSAPFPRLTRTVARLAAAGALIAAVAATSACGDGDDSPDVSTPSLPTISALPTTPGLPTTPDSSTPPSTSPSPSSPTTSAADDTARFKSWVQSSTLPANIKDAVNHVTHVSAEGGITGKVDITTDLTGNAGSTASVGTARLIVTAATDWANAELKVDTIGLITVNSVDGNLLSTGTFGANS